MEKEETVLSLIVAYNNNSVIGKGNKLLWKLSNDLKNVKGLTTNNAIVMGRKTYESLGKPLPNRLNVVLTTDKGYGKRLGELRHNNLKVVYSKSEVLSLKEEGIFSKIYIFGGESIYRLFKEDVEELCITEVDNNLEGDTHFPTIDMSNFNLEEESKYVKDSKNEYSHTIKYYKRK